MKFFTIEVYNSWYHTYEDSSILDAASENYERHLLQMQGVLPDSVLALARLQRVGDDRMAVFVFAHDAFALPQCVGRSIVYQYQLSPGQSNRMVIVKRSGSRENDLMARACGNIRQLIHDLRAISGEARGGGQCERRPGSTGHDASFRSSESRDE